MPNLKGLDSQIQAPLRPPLGQAGWAGNIQDFFKEITDPGGILAMGVGSAAFRAGQALGRGVFSATLPALALGLASESLAFTGVARGYDRWLGRGTSFNAAEWAGQWGTTAFLLGSLRFAGTASLALGGALHGESLAASKVLLPLYRQAGMLGGILLGHGVLEDFQSPAEHLKRSLAYLVQFNAAGFLAQRAVGRYLAPLEGALEARQSPRTSGFPELSATGLERLGLKPIGVGATQGPGEWPLVLMQANRGGYSSGRVAPPAPANREGSGVRLRLKPQEDKIKSLLSRWRLDSPEDPWISEFLAAYGIPTHPLDIRMFRRGFELGQRKQYKIEEIAWDLDEVQLHWALGPKDLFRGGTRGGQFPEFPNTPAELLNYKSFSSAEDVELPRLQKFWFQGVQRLFPTRMRQTLQFQPGLRSLMLGLYFAVRRPLTLCTTGSAGRLLILVNEDQALKQIFFGKFPTEKVTMEEIRNSSNIYTREDLVKALRILAKEKESFAFDADVRSFRDTIARYPHQADKLKHPALAKLVDKRPFQLLIDDSKSARQMLSGIHDFIVLQPPSSRPVRTLNFAMGSPEGYLDKRTDNYAEELAKAIDWSLGGKSRKVSPDPDLPDYPHQRMVIEIPWRRYLQDYVKPGAEIRALGKQIAAEEKKSQAPVVGPYRMTGDGLRFIEPNRRVVLLGDSGLGRILTLAREGHRPILIDWDPGELYLNERLFERFSKKGMESSPGQAPLKAEWKMADWYQTPLDGDAVEVFYPFSDHTIYSSSRGDYGAFARFFMKEALHTKLRPEGGPVYLLTEVTELIRAMEEVVRQDPSLELLGVDLDGRAPPIRGGHGAAFGWRDERVSWILYRKKPR